MTNGVELRIILFVGRARRVRLTIAELCNGSTHDSDSCCLGSNPSSAASTSLHGQAVKTSPSHGENWGSSPHGGTNIVHAMHRRFFLRCAGLQVKDGPLSNAGVQRERQHNFLVEAGEVRLCVKCWGVKRKITKLSYENVRSSDNQRKPF